MHYLIESQSSLEIISSLCHRSQQLQEEGTIGKRPRPRNVGDFPKATQQVSDYTGV